MAPAEWHLNPRQRQLLADWLPDARVVADHSWGLVGTTVLELSTSDGARYIAKAGHDADHHIRRELKAHRLWLAPWASRGRAPELVHADEAAKLLVTRYLPGRLVEGTSFEHDPDTYRQAGELLAELHVQHHQADDGAYERRQREETLGWLNRPHRIPAAHVAALTEFVEQWPAPVAILVPTHGDWQPRNWLVRDGRVSVIDFGRADLRPAATDLARRVAQQFRDDASLEEVFLQSYGPDPREPSAWLRLQTREAVATAAWAYKVGNVLFERQGKRMVAEVIALLGR